MRLLLAPCTFLALALALPTSTAEVQLLSSVPAHRGVGHDQRGETVLVSRSAEVSGSI